VHHVETEEDVRAAWFDAASVIGVTAGTSTPDDVIDRVEARIRLCAAVGRGDQVVAGKGPDDGSPV
jgi:4-hydroxy-3-methylbut-2-enyl diphosphate reductase IspH